MYRMFENCSSLKDINLSSFNTSKVTHMTCMFRGCSSLEKLDLSSFSTDNLESMNYMSCKCSSLKELNISSFKTKNFEYIISHSFDKISSACKLICNDKFLLKYFRQSTDDCLLL